MYSHSTNVSKFYLLYRFCYFHFKGEGLIWISFLLFSWVLNLWKIMALSMWHFRLLMEHWRQLLRWEIVFVLLEVNPLCFQILKHIFDCSVFCYALWLKSNGSYWSLEGVWLLYLEFTWTQSGWNRLCSNFIGWKTVKQKMNSIWLITLWLDISTLSSQYSVFRDEKYAINCQEILLDRFLECSLNMCFLFCKRL